MTMMNRINSVMPQLIAFLSAAFGYLRSASALLYASAVNPLSSVGPILVTTLSAASAGRSVDVKDRPALVRKSFVLSQSENLDHGPTKMWKWQSFAAPEIALALANDSSAGLT